MKFIRQIVRGCGTLPHVGSHPGTGTVFFLVLMCGLAGASKGSWRGALVGAVFMATFMLPLYFYGAYDRANTSDEIEGRRK
jgi:hypothetical protein